MRRSRHALAYLKNRSGDDAMHALLGRDIATMTETVRDWVEASAGRWRSRWAEFVVPGPTAEVFHDWYETAMAERRETELRAGHPEHFISRPARGGIQVAENVGETDLPWLIFYQPLLDGEHFPQPWLPEYPVHFGSAIADQDGLRVGYTLHQLRDAEDGLHMRLTTYLPAASPPELAERHLRHFCIELRNWSHLAAQESRRRP